MTVGFRSPLDLASCAASTVGLEGQMLCSAPSILSLRARSPTPSLRGICRRIWLLKRVHSWIERRSMNLILLVMTVGFRSPLDLASCAASTVGLEGQMLCSAFTTRAANTRRACKNWNMATQAGACFKHRRQKRKSVPRSTWRHALLQL
jgi:hypothetical protein